MYIIYLLFDFYKTGRSYSNILRMYIQCHKITPFHRGHGLDQLKIVIILYYVYVYVHLCVYIS